MTLIDSFSASDPGRRISHTVAIKSVISTEYIQEAASALLWAMLRTVKVIIAVVFVCILNVWSSFTQCLILTANIWIKHKIVSLNTYTFIYYRESKETFTPISVSLLEGMHGENKSNGFSFILANQIPIKLNEKLKSDQREH